MIEEATQDNFGDLLTQTDSLCLVDFWADWCAPCKALLPVLIRVVQAHSGQLSLLTVNAERNQQLTQQFAVRNLPTVLLFRSGQLVDRIEGTLSERQINDLIAPYIQRSSDGLMQAANASLDSGDVQQAITLMQQAIDADPMRADCLAALLQLQIDSSLRESDSSFVMAAAELVNTAHADVQRDPVISRLHSRIRLMLNAPVLSDADLSDLGGQVAGGNVEALLTLSQVQAAAGNYAPAIERLLSCLAVASLSESQRQQVTNVLVELLNSAPERELANDARRRMFTLNT